MKKPTQLIDYVLSPDISPAQRRRIRIPLTMAVAVGFVAALSSGTEWAGDATANQINGMTKEYGCATTVVTAGQTAIQAALEAGRQVADVSGNTNLQAVITYEASSIPDSADINAGQTVTTCVEHNPVTGFGNGGWVAQVTISEAK